MQKKKEEKAHEARCSGDLAKPAKPIKLTACMDQHRVNCQAAKKALSRQQGGRDLEEPLGPSKQKPSSIGVLKRKRRGSSLLYHLPSTGIKVKKHATGL